ncbi:hypothetical protein [Leifsonia sp. Le1]|uniref:hypothetical protein n=1 Tax=Leifsonia sp. Le1 TaxID=3404918 RepID=UPI003EBF5D5B
MDHAGILSALCDRSPTALGYRHGNGPGMLRSSLDPTPKDAVMAISILIIDGTRFPIDIDPEAVKKSITEALREGGGFVAITTTDGRQRDVLFTGSTRATIEYVADTSEGAGAGAPEPFLPDDFNLDYGL